MTSGSWYPFLSFFSEMPSLARTHYSKDTLFRSHSYHILHPTPAQEGEAGGAKQQ